MSEMVAVAKTNELNDGSMKAIKRAAGRSFWPGQADLLCSRCPLSSYGCKPGGRKLEGTVVTCPRHGSQFDLSTGAVVRWLNKSGPLQTLSKAIKHESPLTTYKVTVKGDTIMVDI
jgi:3-phenylpropionate/trans-cinnamate dioxygenase ferredoxin subunit